MVLQKKKVVIKKKPAPKKVVAKKPLPKKPIAKKPVMKAAPKKAVARKPVPIKRKPAVVPKPRAPVPARVAPKPPAKPKATTKASVTMYRKLRKYTVPKLLPYLTEAGTAELRLRIGSNVAADVPLAAWELLEFLQKQEGEVPNWKKTTTRLPGGAKAKMGRPSGVKKGLPPPPSTNAAATVAAASTGSLVKPPAFTSGLPPVVARRPFVLPPRRA